MMAVIGVCSFGQESSIKSLLREIQNILSRSGDEVRFIKLPYSDLDSFELARGTVDGIILCHSIHNRRFSITDVCDALYDRFLPRMAETFGKNNVAVIVYDFQWHTHGGSDDRSSIHQARMASFRIKQPTTFECSELAITCGRLDSKLEIDTEDRQDLEGFLLHVQPKEREPPQDGSSSFLRSLGAAGLGALAAYLLYKNQRDFSHYLLITLCKHFVKNPPLDVIVGEFIMHIECGALGLCSVLLDYSWN